MLLPRTSISSILYRGYRYPQLSITRSNLWRHSLQSSSTPRLTLLMAERRLGGLGKSDVTLGRRSFHSTPRNEGIPLIPILASLLKSSAGLEIARTVGRITLTLAPMLMLKSLKAKHMLKTSDAAGSEVNADQSALASKIQKYNIIFRVLLFVPITLFLATLLASSERTPLTGRWRLIILSPEEEDEIARQLAGPGWYQAVGEILSQEGADKVVPAEDWRYSWVRDTLRRLESTIPLLLREHELQPVWLQRGQDDVPLPPPADYPLRPRPRASESLHSFCEAMSKRSVPPMPHTIPGPPYSLLLIDKPDACNAFSYGFGPDGAGGVVVYSGFLDEILSKSPPGSDATPLPSTSPDKSWYSQLLGISLSPAPQARNPTPTPEQTTELAILLSHELAHLILSHHLETLSSSNLILPGAISIATDIARAILFPLTMLFGPFVNDAVAQLGKVSSGELTKIGEYCSAMVQEIEADVVSTRLLAYAGFDAREAVKFWEERTLATECSAKVSDKHLERDNPSPVRRIMGDGHPVHETRIERLREELARWQWERQTALNRLQTQNKGTGTGA